MTSILNTLSALNWPLYSKVMLLIAFVFIINVPFGYWRENCRRFSFTWFLAIHLPVPFIYIARNSFAVPFYWIPMLIAPFWGGQKVGGKVRLAQKKKKK